MLHSYLLAWLNSAALMIFLQDSKIKTTQKKDKLKNEPDQRNVDDFGNWERPEIKDDLKNVDLLKIKMTSKVKITSERKISSKIK